MKWVGLVVLLCTAACLDGGTSECAGGYICPAGRACAPEPLRGCLFPAQLTVCDGLAELDPCSAEGQDGFCRAGVCALHKCGDGLVSGAEVCDPHAPIPDAMDDCTEHAYYAGGKVGCTPECRWDYAECSDYCGDGTVNGNEFCEGGVVPSDNTCLSFGFDRGLVSCSARCSPSLTACSNMGWYLDRPGTGDFLEDVWMAANGEVFVVGNFGVVLHWDGTDWHRTTIPEGIRLLTVWGSGPDDVFATSASGVYHWDGSSWMLHPAGAPSKVTAIWGTGPGDVYAVWREFIYHFDGTTWSTLDTGVGAVGLTDIWGSANGELWATGYNVLGHRSSTGTWTWDSPGGTTQRWNAVWGRGSKDVYAVSEEGSIVRWNGATWLFMKSPSGLPLRSLWGVAGGVFAGSDGEVLYLDGSAAWSRMPLETGSSIGGVSGRDENDVIAVSGLGTVHRYDGAGSWTTVASRLDGVATAYATAADDVLLGGLYGTVAHYDGTTLAATYVTGANVFDFARTDEGWFALGPASLLFSSDRKDWQFVSGLPASSGWSRAWAGPGTALYIAGLAGLARRHADGTWDVFPEAGTDLYDVWGTADDDITVVGSGGVIRHFDGTSWTVEPTPVVSSLNAVHGVAGHRVAVGHNGVVLHNAGAGWTQAANNSTAGLFDVWVGSATDAVAVGSNGTVLIWDGTQWEPTRAPTVADILSVSGPPGALHFMTSAAELLELVRTQLGGCASVESSCGNFWDDDCDGDIDCADADCAGASWCESQESRCDDSIDNDGDGAEDCADTDCTAAVVEDCGDGIDNDCDGQTDCDDDECISASNCVAGGICADSQDVTCNVLRAGTNVGGPSNISQSVCGIIPNTGPEAYFRFQTLMDGAVQVTLSGMSADLDLYVVAANGGACDTSACVDASATTIGDESVTFDAVANTVYYLIADGYNGATSSFTLSVQCAN